MDRLILDGNHQAVGVNVGDNPFARFVAVKAAIGVRNKVERVDVADGPLSTCGYRLGAFGSFRIRRAIAAHRGDFVHKAVHRDAVALRDAVIILVVRAGNLHRARSKIGVGIFVSDNRDQAAMVFRADGDFTKFADDRLVALIARMHRNRAVT